MAEHAPRDGTAAGATGTGAVTRHLALRDPDVLGTTISEVLREGLAHGTDRAALDAMLAAVGARLGYEAILVGRHDGEEMVIVGAYGHTEERIVGDHPERFPTDQGLAGVAFTTGRPARTDDAWSDPRWHDVSAGRNRSGLCLPMRLPDRVWGVVGVESVATSAFGDDDVALLQPIADTMAWVLESARLRQEADARAEREQRLRRGLEASAAVVTAGLEATELGTAFDRMVREIRDQLEWRSLAVLLCEGRTLRVASQYGYEQDIAGATYSVDRGILGHVATTGRPYLAEDTSLDPYYDDVVGTTRSELCVPLRLAGRVRGLLNVESPVPGALTSEDLRIAVRIADQMSLIMHNVELLSAEKETVARLHELDRLKSRLLTIASHELRTPLTVVMGFAEVLAKHADGIDGDKAREYAAAIARQAGSLAELVDQMQLATQIEQRELTVHAHPVSVASVVASALGARRAEHIEVGAGVAEARVVADPFRLQQVLEGLFDNAIKYAADAGRIQVDARERDGHVTIRLRDEGPGIAGYEQQRVFEPFHQVGQHGVTGRRGVGLGLAVARDLVALMDGDLQLFSAPGYGATFTITLPAA